MPIELERFARVDRDPDVQRELSAEIEALRAKRKAQHAAHSIRPSGAPFDGRSVGPRMSGHHKRKRAKGKVSQ